VGVVVLVVGLGLLAVGGTETVGSLTIIKTFNEQHPGEYVSPEIDLNTTSVIEVQSPGAVSGVVHAQDLDSVNSTNLASYALKPNATVVRTQQFRGITGDYYYVAFSSTPPSGTHVVVTPLRSGVIRFVALILVGLVCVVAGIVVAVIGLRRDTRPLPQEP
jgi:hypothetical protein